MNYLKKISENKEEDDLEVDNNTKEVNEKESSCSIEDLLSCMLHSVNQTRLFHLQCALGGNTAIHQTLEKYYEKIADIFDDVAESYMGRKKMIIDVLDVSGEMKEFSKENIYTHLEYMLSKLEKYKEDYKDMGDICNLLDEGMQIINTTCYLLDLEFGSIKTKIDE